MNDANSRREEQPPADVVSLKSRIRAGARLMAIETRDENRVVDLFGHVRRDGGLPLIRWTATEGLRRMDADLHPPGDTLEPEDALRHIRDRAGRSVFLLMDFHPYFQDPVIVRLLREIGRAEGEGRHLVVLVSPALDLPRELGGLASRFELSLPGPDELEQMVREEARNWARENDNQKVKTSPRALELLISNLSGLPMKDARRLARNAIWDDGAIGEQDLPDLMQTKFELLDPDGLLTFEMETERFSRIAGMNRLRSWLEQRATVFTDEEPPKGLDVPKGVLLLGVQGCGKSVAARAVAGIFGVPLLSMDCGGLHNRYQGESERNLRESLASAETMAPCVLWMDEIEKGMAVSDSDGGTSRRMLGSFLTWMAERRSRVFLVATANEIDQLPPELIRQGRFDEIFFVDLPDTDTRVRILSLHLERRGLNSREFRLDELAGESEGFSGAELEQAVISAQYAAHGRGGEQAGHEDLARAIADTRPLSVVMAERVAELRDWARQRTVPAD